MIRFSRVLLLAVVGLCLTAACGDPAKGSKTDTAETLDPCADAPAPILSVEGLEAVYPVGTTSITFSLVFDRAVEGVDASTFSVSGGSATLAQSGGPERYSVTVEGLETNGDYTVTAAAGSIASTDCHVPLAGPLETTFAVEGWTHRGEVTWGVAAPLKGPAFVDVTEAVGLAGATEAHGRAAVVDFDGDGHDDLVVWPVTTTPMTPRFLHRTTDAAGGPAFEDVTATTGLADEPVTILTFGDIDNDGDQDIFAGLSLRSAEGKLGIWSNDGEGHFTFLGDGGIAPALVTTLQGHAFYKEMSAATLADFDRDGFLDLYIATWRSGSPTTDGVLNAPDDELYRGDGSGQFAAVTLPDQRNPLTAQVDPSQTSARRAAYGACPADFDGDGDLDLFVNNYGAGRPAAGSPPTYVDHNLLWRNDSTPGTASFVDVGASAGVAATMRGIGGVEAETPLVMNGTTYPAPIGGNGFGCSWGDVDNDGDMDLVVGTIAHPDYAQSDRTMLHINQGGPSPVFTEESAARGLKYYEDELHPVLVDVDLDGRLDLAVSRLRGGSKWELYFQYADGMFVQQPYTVSGVDVARPGPTLWTDLDGDGDLDFYMARDSAGAGGSMFRNEIGQRNHWLVLELVATGPRDATGARVVLESSVGSQVREIVGGTGHYVTQQSRTLHFGLGGDSGARSVSIRWPDGEVQALGDLRANVRLRVTQGGGIELL